MRSPRNKAREWFWYIAAALLAAFLIWGALLALRDFIRDVLEVGFVGVLKFVGLAIGVLLIPLMLGVADRLNSVAVRRGLKIRQLLWEGLTGEPTERTIALNNAAQVVAKAEANLARAQLVAQTQAPPVWDMEREVENLNRALALKNDPALRQVRDDAAERLKVMESNLETVKRAEADAQAALTEAQIEQSCTWAEGTVFRGVRLERKPK